MPEHPPAPHHPASGFHDSLTRNIRATYYLRVLFSLVLLSYSGFGPSVLMRFPASPMGDPWVTVAKFYAFRPVIYAMLFVALICVLAALARRSVELFRVEVETWKAGPAEFPHHLRPSAFPFVLSGNAVVDVLIYMIVLLAYSFWIIALVETTPSGMSSYGIAGIVLGSYGLFAALIVSAWVWVWALRRLRTITSLTQTAAGEPPSAAGTRGTGTAQ